METINRNELQDAIRGIVNEELRTECKKPYDGTTIFNIDRYINGLMSEGKTNPKLMSYLMRFNESLAHGAKQFMLFEMFGKGLNQFATGNKAVKSVINAMNETLSQHNNELVAFTTIEKISDEYCRETIRESYNEFLADPCDETKMMLRESVDNLFGVDMNLATKMNLIITNAIDEKVDFFSTTAMNESAQDELNRRLEENRQARLANNIIDKAIRYINERYNVQDEKQQQLNETYSLQGIANNNGLNLYERLSKVLKSDAAKNENLKNIILEYTEALAQGAYEERLYETLLQRTAKYDYLLPVEKMRNAIVEKVNEKHEEITLTKILEMMKDSYSSYIYVDIIQEDVARYVLNPNPTNRAQLRNALMPYAHDPYITEMFNIIFSDDKISSNELSEMAMSIKDQMNIIKENASVSNIYSPVLYIKENESVFNVHGTYFIKKGNNMSILDKKYIPQLNERFVELCHLVNDPHVQIFEDHIVLNGTEHYATIYEGYVDICGYKEDAESLRRLDEMCMKYENYDTNFYIMCSCLLENFNNIANIDFAKHVTLNENSDITADIFKLDESIYMSTHNNALMKHKFYRNVNPIACKNMLNEHMGINVSYLFEDMLPNQKSLIIKLNETKEEYESSIEKLEDMKAQLADALKDATSDEIIKQLKDGIDKCNDELEDIKAEYKEWQKTTDKTLGKDAEEDDAEEKTDDEENVTREVSNEPIDAKDVTDELKDEYSTPIEDETAAVSDDSIVSDDEFSDMLQNDADEENAVDGGEDDVIDTDTIDAASMEAPTEDDTVDTTDDTEATDELPQAESLPNDEDDTTTADYTDDNIFDDEVEDDDINDTTSNEETPSDEDIIIGDDYDEVEPETPDVDTVDLKGDEVTADDVNATDDGGESDEEGVGATDLFGGDTENPLGDVDVDLYNPNTQTNEFNIVNVMFDENVKDGTISKSGEVLVLRPMVDANGQKRADSQNIRFYLNGDNSVVIESKEDMSVALYDAIINAVKTHPQFKTVCNTGVEAVTASGEIDEPIDNSSSEDWESEYNAAKTAEDNGNFVIGDEDDADVEDIPSVIDTDDIENDDDLFKGAFGDDDEVETTDALPTETVDTEDENGAEVDDTVDYDFGDIFDDIEDDDEDAAAAASETPADDTDVVNDPVQTYTDEEGTEIEIPAADSDEDDTTEDEIEFDDMEDIVSDDDDETVIPESKATKKGKAINENRKRIVGIKGVKKGF